MILFLECIVGCLLFTLMILPAQYKDPIKMIMSYPPNIRKRVEELPQYRDSIQKREKAHIGKKIFGIVFFVFVFSAVAYFSGCRDFKSAFFSCFYFVFCSKSF